MGSKADFEERLSSLRAEILATGRMLSEAWSTPYSVVRGHLDQMRELLKKERQMLARSRASARRSARVKGAVEQASERSEAV